MRMEFELELTDAPGALATVLRAVADHGGNVLGVFHRHGQEHGARVPVAFAIEIDDAHALRLMDQVARSHRILRMDHEDAPASRAVMLAGPIVQVRLDEILESAWASAEVDRVDMRTGERGASGAALVRLRAGSQGALSRAIDALQEAADQAGLRVIQDLESP